MTADRDMNALNKTAGKPLLGQLPVFEGLEPSLLGALDLAEEAVSYEAGDTVIASGQFDGSLLYGIVSGRARIVRPAVQAGDFEVVEAQPGEVVGLAELFAHGDQAQTGLGMTALTPLDLVLIDGTLLLERTGDTPVLSAALLRYMARQWLDAGGVTETEGHRDRRLLRHLLSLTEQQGDLYIIPEMPRHAQLAEQCGVTDRDAAAVMAILIEKGMVRREYPSLVIEDMAALRASAY